MNFILRQRRATKLPLATLIGKAKQEGITSEGSYTWSNLWLLIDCALVGGVQGESKYSPFGRIHVEQPMVVLPLV